MLPALILDSPVDLAPEPPEFESLAAAELGNAGADDDGFDVTFAAAMSAFGDAEADTGSLRVESDAALTVLPELAQDETSPLTAELAPHVTDGDTLLADFERDFDSTQTNGGGSPLPPTVPATPVVSVGGGGQQPCPPDLDPDGAMPVCGPTPILD